MVTKQKLHDKSTYVVQIESPGYINYTGKIDLTRKLAAIRIQFQIGTIARGHFSKFAATYCSGKRRNICLSLDELNMVVDFLVTNPTVEIELSGHTDDAGPAKIEFKTEPRPGGALKHHQKELLPAE